MAAPMIRIDFLLLVSIDCYVDSIAYRLVIAREFDSFIVFSLNRKTDLFVSHQLTSLSFVLFSNAFRIARDQTKDHNF